MHVNHITPTTTRHSRRRLRGIGVALLSGSMLVGLAACGDEDGDKAAISAEACDAVVAIGSAMSGAPQDPAEFGPFAEEQLVPVGDVLVEELDGDAKTAAETLAAAYREVAETGDPSGLFEDDAVAEATSTIGALAHGECDLQAVTIGAIEYAYVGAPDELDAGRVSFALQNTGVEEHEMVLFRRADGATETLEQILELPEEEQFSKMTFTGVAFGGPDTTTYTAMDLEPGTYFLLCFIPQGEDGPPHFLGGMQHTFVVS